MLFAPAIAESAPPAKGEPPSTGRKNLVHSVFGAPDIPEPPRVTEDGKDTKAKDDKRLNPDDSSIFGEDDADTKEVKKKSGKTDKIEDNTEDAPPDTDLEDDATADDLDAPLVVKKPKASDDKDDKAVSGKGAKDIREHLEIVSAQAKKYAAANKILTERLKKFESVATEADLEEPSEPVKVNVNEDATFNKHKTSILSRLDTGIAVVDNELAAAWADQDGGAVFSTTLENFARDLKGAKSATDKTRVTRELRDRLAAKFSDTEKEVDGKEAAAHMVRILTDSIPDLESMYSRRAELETTPAPSRDKATVYKVRRTAAEELVAGAGDYPDSVVEDHPHSVAAYLHSLKDLPKFKPRLDKARSLVADLLSGPPEISKEEQEKLKKSGGDELVTKTIRQRRDEWSTNREKLAHKLVEALLFLPQAPDILKRLNEMSSRVTDEEEDRGLLEGIREERGVDKSHKEKKGAGSPQKKLINELFGV